MKTFKKIFALLLVVATLASCTVPASTQAKQPSEVSGFTDEDFLSA